MIIMPQVSEYVYHYCVSLFYVVDYCQTMSYVLDMTLIHLSVLALDTAF